MSKLTSLSIFLLCFLYLTVGGLSSTVEIQNNCSYDVWVAAVPGGGKHLLQNQTWTISSATKVGDDLWIWGRTNCSFDKSGRGRCISGDCDGLLHCRNFSRSSVTLASVRTLLDESEMAADYYGISILDGYNIPMQFKGIYDKMAYSTKVLKYTTANIDGSCPSIANIKTCDKYCTIYKNEKYCYQTCENKLDRPTTECREKDPRFVLDHFHYPSGANEYKVMFCP